MRSLPNPDLQGVRDGSLSQAPLSQFLAHSIKRAVFTRELAATDQYDLASGLMLISVTSARRGRTRAFSTTEAISSG